MLREITELGFTKIKELTSTIAYLSASFPVTARSLELTAYDAMCMGFSEEYILSGILPLQAEASALGFHVDVCKVLRQVERAGRVQ